MADQPDHRPDPVRWLPHDLHVNHSAMVTQMTRARHKIAMPDGLPPRGIGHDQAAAYVGISPSKFDQLLLANQMPKPKLLGGVQVWDVRALDKAFDALPTKDAGNDNWKFEA